MDFQEIPLYFFSCLGVFNGLLLSGYLLLILKPRKKQNIYLGLLLLALCIRIGKSVIFYFSPDVTYISIYLQVGLTACIIIGPLLYLYVYHFYHPEEASRKKILHVLIPLILATIMGILFPYYDYREIWLQYIMLVIYGLWFMYLMFAAKLLFDFRSSDRELKKSTVRKRFWIQSVLYGNILIWAAYVFAGLTSYILGAVSFSFILYLLIFLLVMNANDRESIFFPKSPKYGGRTLAKKDADPILKSMQDYLSEPSIFTNPDLKIKEVAIAIGTTAHTLSQTINSQLGKSFPQVLNELRIKEAKNRILTNSDFTLEGIGQDCGYRSKSTFYAAFKKITGTTPAEFRKNSELDQKLV